MNEMSEREEELFDFSDQVFREPSSINPKDKKDLNKGEEKTDKDNEVYTSYLLVNALLNLLIQKGMIYPHEVNAIIAELHEQYVKRKGE